MVGAQVTQQCACSYASALRLLLAWTYIAIAGAAWLYVTAAGAACL